MKGGLGSIRKAVMKIFHSMHGRDFCSTRSPVILVKGRRRGFRTFGIHLGRPCSRGLGHLGRFVKGAFPGVSLRFIPISHVIGSKCGSMCHFHGSM